MYYYIIKSAKTGKVIAEGTAGQLSRAGLYSTPDSVRTAYNEWRRRTERGLKTSKMWTRKGEPDQAPKAPPGQKKRGDRLTWRQKQARDARQGDAARASQPPRKGYTNEQLGKEFVLPEHMKKFAQPPLLPQGTGKNAPTALQLDCYELERLNWRRRQEGKPALSYGIWASLGKPKA